MSITLSVKKSEMWSQVCVKSSFLKLLRVASRTSLGVVLKTLKVDIGSFYSTVNIINVDHEQNWARSRTLKDSTEYIRPICTNAMTIFMANKICMYVCIWRNTNAAYSLQDCNLPTNHSRIHTNNLSAIPWLSNFRHNLICGTLSKALAKSMNTTSTSSPKFTPPATLSRKEGKLVKHERLFVSHAESLRLVYCFPFLIMDSNNLHTWLVRLTDL